MKFLYKYKTFIFSGTKKNISFKQQYLFCYERIKVVTNKFLVKSVDTYKN